MIASKFNIIIEQGTTYSEAFPLEDVNGLPLDVTGYTAVAKMRRDYASVNSVSFTVTLANGSITLAMANNITSIVEAGRYVYDVKVYAASNNVSRIFEGIATVTPEVSK